MNPSLCLPLSLVTLCLAAPVVIAQRPLVLPAKYTDSWGRSSSSVLGGNSTRTQMVFAQPFALNTPVFGVGVRAAASTSDRAAFTAEVEIRMSSTATAPNAVSATFANNTGSDEVVALPRQMVNIQAMPANRSTTEFARFPFATPFIFGTNGNSNINVDLLLYSRSTGASWSTDRGFASTSGHASTAGIGCGNASVGSTSSNGSYVAGATINFSLSGATPNSSAMLLPSINMSTVLGGIPLPFDLQPIGAAAGCVLLVDPSLGSLTVPTDGSGSASVALTVPNIAGDFGTGWQWGYLVPPSANNPIGLETTANRAIWVGPEVVGPAARYVWHLSNVNSATGTATTDSVPVTMFLVP